MNPEYSIRDKIRDDLHGLTPSFLRKSKHCEDFTRRGGSANWWRRGGFILITLLLILLQINTTTAQIQIGENVSFGGRINMDMNVYNRFNAPSSRENFRFKVYAQPYFKIKDWDIKMNLLFGDYHKKYKQEFNKFGTTIGNDKYKFHLGHHNLQLSNFSLNGHTILGGGLELYPGKFRFGASYGRFRRDIDPTSFSTTDFVLPSFNRFGVVGKIGIGTKDNFLDVIVLRITDNSSSLSAGNAGTVLPQDNAVLSLHTVQKVFKNKLILEGELALSAFTTDNTNTEKDSSNFKLAKVAGYMLDRNATSEYSKAIQVSITYNNLIQSQKRESYPKMSGFMIKGIYERIDPYYRSMGTYYLRNDLQRVRVTAQMRFLKNKLILVPQVGYENNDLDKVRTTRNKRFLGGLQSTVRINNQTFFNVGYLNFNSALETNTTDSLVLRKVTHNTTFAFTNRHVIKEKKNMLRINLGYQTGKNKTTEANANYLGNFSMRTGYSMTIIDKKLELEPALRVNTYKRQFGGNSARFTPSITAKSKFIDNKMALNYDLAAIIVRIKGTGVANTAIRNQIRWSYRFHKTQSVTFRLGYQQNLINGGSNYSDLQMDLRYAISL